MRLRSSYGLWSPALLFAILILASSEAVPQTWLAGFEGQWQLNREKSEGLTGGMGSADLLLFVTLADNQLTVDQKTRIRGRVQPSEPLTYRLDGRETTAEVVRPLAGTMELEAKVFPKNREIRLKSTISGDDRGRPVTLITREFWELIDGGTRLRILRTREIGEKSSQMTLVFERQPETK